MELTAEEVDEIESVRQLVMDLQDYAEKHPDSVLDLENLMILEAQLDGLHQGLSMAVTQKRAIQSDSSSEKNGQPARGGDDSKGDDDG